MPITANRKAVARNSGTRKMRILAFSVSSTARKKPPMASFKTSAGKASSMACGAWASATPQGKILGSDGDAIPGLYGVGNCVASPSGRAYFSAGSTFGPIMTVAYLAAQSLAVEPRREA